MPSLVVIGAQWGDEGKGKIVDYITKHTISTNTIKNSDNFSMIVARFQGGNNAGHTLVVNGKKTKLTLIPSGILHPKAVCAIGAGAVLDPERFAEELNELKSAGVAVSTSNLAIDERVHLVLPYHRLLDIAKEAQLGSNRIGTTGRGVGPTYADRINRVGILAIELKYIEPLKIKLEKIIESRNIYLKEILHTEERIDFASVWKVVESSAKLLTPYLTNVSRLVNSALDKGDSVLLEGAQGALLDNLFGTFPYVTSSHTVAGSAAVGIGLGPTRIDSVLGVTKSYSTRVGSGPFPSEDLESDGNTLRERGGEFGTVTKRPRRCGWLDLVALKESIRLSGITYLAITKLDVLSGFSKIKVAVSYQLPSGEEIDYIPPFAEAYDAVKPVYKEFAGWQEDLTGIRSYVDLPENLKKFISFIEAQVSCPIKVLSVGAERDATIFKDDVTGFSFFC
jgi:adenylosuccinate synthase